MTAQTFAAGEQVAAQFLIGIGRQSAGTFLDLMRTMRVRETFSSFAGA